MLSTSMALRHKQIRSFDHDHEVQKVQGAMVEPILSGSGVKTNWNTHLWEKISSYEHCSLKRSTQNWLIGWLHHLAQVTCHSD